MTNASEARLLLLARLAAGAAGVIACLAVIGYFVDLPALVRVRDDLQGMSPLTALSLLALAAGAIAATEGRSRAVQVNAGVASTAVAITFIARMVSNSDTASLWVGTALFKEPAAAVGRTSIATALCVLLIAAALLTRHARPRIADVTAGAALVISGMALLGYFYGVRDLYALPMFNSMALNTAVALFLLAAAALLAEPKLGWAGVIGSEELGGGATRRQLAFIAVPIIAGWLLLAATSAAQVGPAVAMALLVIVTVVPLAILILRDGRVLNQLDGERRGKTRLQEQLTNEMTRRLSEQATELAQESEERARAEAVLYRAQRMEAVGHLTGGIAHDFNNLLMAIRGNLELLGGRLPPDEERLRRYVDNATAATDKGAKITAQLLAFSRSQRLAIRSVELGPVLTSARELIGNALGPDVHLEMNLETDSVWVDTDPDQLELAILNLAVNARDAMPHGGRIVIESRSCRERLSEEHDEARYASIRVIDNGAGMTADVLSQAAEPFFTTKERGKGTGLGLAQVYGFVRQCGGDLRIESTPGEGTRVEILLRCATEVAALAPASEVKAPSDLVAAGRQVLVIDDDEGVRAVIVDALTIAGFDVSQAADGESGLALLERISPAAAVIDFLMPGMNGAEVARIAQQRRPGLPIVFVSGYSDTVALDGIAGAAVLRKPFDIDGLSRALSSVLH